MKKELALAAALPLALGSGLACASTVKVDGGSGSKSTSVTSSDLSNLRSNATADVQVSSGVMMQLQDGEKTGPPLVGANDIAVTTCHEGGNAAYFGDTGGGSVGKNVNFGTNNCGSPSDVGWTIANT